MLKKSKEHEVWFHVMDGKKVGIVARVPELLRLNLITLGDECTVKDLNKWLYIAEVHGTYGVIEYNTFEDAKDDLV